LLDRALAVNPRFSDAFLERGEVRLIRARWAKRQGGPAMPCLLAARKAFKLAARFSSPQQAPPFEGLLRVALELRDRSEGNSALKTLMQYHGKSPWTQAFQGAWRLREAQALRGDQRKRAVLEAKQLLEEAMEKGPALRVEFGPCLQEAKRAISSSTIRIPERNGPRP
jgi:hypothetical protein